MVSIKGTQNLVPQSIYLSNHRDEGGEEKGKTEDWTKDIELIRWGC